MDIREPKTNSDESLNQGNVNQIIESQRHIPWIVYDEEDTIIAANKAVTELYCHQNDDLIGKPRSFLVLTEEVHNGNNHYASTDSSSGVSANLATIIDKNNTKHKILILRYPVLNKIYEVKSYAEQHFPMALQRKIFLNVPFDEILYRISHDIRSPIRHINTYTDLILNQPNSSPEELEKWKLYISISSDKINKLVDDLILYMNIKHEKNDHYNVSLKDILRSLSELHSIPISCQSEVLISANVKQITHALEILLKNSISFKHPDRELKIEVNTEDKGNIYLISFKDNGIGIHPEDKERIFDFFEKGMNSIDHPGNGIGLTLARKIINLHGGNIWVESVLGQNSTFHLSLPK